MENKTLGQKIEYYRKRAKMSQLDLEIAIGAGQGSISRIENGQVNPTKETIIAIAKALSLSDPEIASLFQLEFGGSVAGIDLIGYFEEVKDMDSTIQRALNEIAEKLNYINVSVYLLDEKRVLHALYINHNPFIDAVFKLLPIPFNRLTIDEARDKNNLLLKVALGNEVCETDDLYDIARGVVPEATSKAIQKALRMKSALAIPLSFNGHSIGAMMFSKNSVEDYSNEISIAKALSRQMTVALILQKLKDQINKVYGF